MILSQGVESVLHILQTSVCPWETAQTKDVCLAFGNNRALVLQGHGHRCDPSDNLTIVPRWHHMLLISILRYH